MEAIDLADIRAHAPLRKDPEIAVAARKYKREKREDQINPRTGKPTLVWQRYGRGGVVEISLKDGSIKAIAPDAEFQDVYVQGQIRKRSTHCVDTLFLVNAQEEGRPKDESHVFQPKLTVQAVDGEAIFCKRTTVGSTDDFEEHPEEAAGCIVLPFTSASF